jgi:y4mF family transcriptional regulator
MKLKTVRDIAAVVKKRRQNMGWTQSDLATRSGVSREWLIDLEKSKSTVELALVLRTLKALGIQLETPHPDLLGLTALDEGDALANPDTNSSLKSL